MTKVQAVAEFKATILPEIKAKEALGTGRVDSCMRAEAWNNYTDMLCKDQQITSSQYHNWSNPF